MSINRHYKQVLNNQSLLTRLSNFIDSSYSVNAERLCFYGIIHDNNNNGIEILNLKVISPATFISSSWHHVMRVKKGRFLAREVLKTFHHHIQKITFVQQQISIFISINCYKQLLCFFEC
jgi:hypothetical protein